MSIYAEGLLIVAAMLTISTAGLFIVRRFVRKEILDSTHGFSDPIWGVVAGAFGLLLGFMVVTLWENLNEAELAVQNEANHLSDLFRLTQGYPEPERTELRQMYRDYARIMVEREWTSLAETNQPDPEARDIADRAANILIGLSPRSGANADVVREGLRQMNEFSDARRRRIDIASEAVPSVLWIVMFGGVAIAIVLAWISGPENLVGHIILTTIVTLSLAMILFLIQAFNNPYRGDVRADPDAFERALREFDRATTR